MNENKNEIVPNIDGHASKPHNDIFPNFQERQKTH